MWFFLLLVLTGTRGDDLVANLPGVSFQTNFNHYSGYVANSMYHYWYFESQNNVTTDPLIMFIAGGPGCSSVYAALEEIGPFKVYPDSATLYENVFSWNKMANLLFLDVSGIGFSAVKNNGTLADTDVVTALQNGLWSFYCTYKQLAANPLFIAGQGYASVYATKLANSLAQTKIPDALVNLQGVILANGHLSQSLQYDSTFSYAYMHGYAGKDAWDSLQLKCCNGQSSYSCSYFNSTDQACITAAKNAQNTWISSLIDKTDIYKDCYFPTMMKSNIQNSTDAFNSYPCLAGQAIQTYLARTDVRTALHIANGTGDFVTCSAAYQVFTQELQTDFLALMNTPNYTVANGSILIYNGDLDFSFNFISSRKFATQIANIRNMTMTKDEPWNANYHRYVYNDTDGGLRTEFTNRLYLLTIRGGGYKAAINRPAQVLQIVRNYVRGFGFNNCLSALNLGAQALLPNYQYLNPPPKRQQTDLVTFIPGITFQTSGWKQYSGFLDGGNSTKIHYWFVESIKGANSPVILWLGGGPGGSALRGLLNEHGPFRPNRNGESLYENYYSWNKFANLLYIESPIGVGFSYSSSNLTLNDDTTAIINYNALKDFLNSFPEYNGEFFIASESYGAVFVSTLAKTILDGIKAKDIKINIKGLAIGNGAFSAAQQANSVVFQKYVYGLVGKIEYDSFTADCCNQSDPTTCDFYGMYLTVDNYGNYKLKDGVDKKCGNLTMSFIDTSFFTNVKSDKNLYQDCYTQKQTNPSSLPQNRNFNDYAQLINVDSTDPFNGFPCWKDAATESYMNMQSVRRALNIPDDAPAWKTYNPSYANTYIQQYPDLTNLFASVIEHQEYKNNTVRTLIYNGDVDLLCNHLGNQWFVQDLAKKVKLITKTKYEQWLFELPGEKSRSTVGYLKRYSENITYVTLKGAGHNSIMDRPAPALQMMHNFIMNINTGISLNTTVSISPSPMLPGYQNMGPCQPTPAATPSAFSPVNMVKNMDAYTVRAQADQIDALPGLPYKPNFNMFGGYISPKEYPKNFLYYWFTESQSNATTDPVVLWFNGGPGCSGLGGFFEELGPFHNNDDGGKTLYENVYSWNKKANILFLEMPVGVGFSYTTDLKYLWNDDTTALNNALALKVFFEDIFPQYAANEFYITSESYGGVYVPTLSLNLINMIQNGTLNLNFKGFAIGNGYLSHRDQSNSELTFQYGHGFNNIDEWDNLKSKCKINDTNPIYYDYNGQPIISKCYGAADSMTSSYFDATETDPYDIYVDCYAFENTNRLNVTHFSRPTTRGEKMRAAREKRKRMRSQLDSEKPFVNNNDGAWYGSTDAFLGLPCYNDDQLALYLNNKTVQTAIHAKAILGKQWTDCSTLLYIEQKKYFDMSNVLNSIMDSDYYKNNMRIMLYNGDADTICQFLGDQWWAERLIANRSMQILYDRRPWYYQKSLNDPQILAGYVKAFTENFVQMTVKGAGHMVPMDRPGPALQMLLNFLSNSKDYSTYMPVDTTHQPLFRNYQNTDSSVCSRKDSDRILNLPGLDVSKNFDKIQFSGFLKGSNTHYLHYWLYDSVNNQAGGNQATPLILWLNGGPGTSSLDGLFMENGLYRLNRDGKTISRNPNAWDFATMLYLESPVGVGYSYTSDGVTPTWSDNNTAIEAYNALIDFYSVFPEYRVSPLFIAGESYGGIYIPMLSKLIIDGISVFPINFMGIAIGNGVLDKAIDTNSLPHSEYYRGGIPLTRYQELNSLCCSDVVDELSCDYSKHISDFNSSYYGGNQSDPCYTALMSLATDVLVKEFDPYNLYQQCYEYLDSGVTQGTPVGETWTGINYESSDPNNAYWCWYKNALTNYLNLPEVRRALNIPNGVQYWMEDAGIMGAYQQQVSSTNDIISYILNSDYAKTSNFNTLIYHGDVDTMKNWLGGEWFTYHLFNDILHLNQISNRTAWTFMQNLNSPATVGGYVRQYERNVTVMTVRGAGHEVPFDRPGQAYSMMKNWLASTGALSSTSTTAQPTTVTTTTTAKTKKTTTPKPTTATTSSTVTNKPTTATIPPTTPVVATSTSSSTIPSTTQSTSTKQPTTTTTGALPTTTTTAKSATTTTPPTTTTTISPSTSTTSPPATQSTSTKQPTTTTTGALPTTTTTAKSATTTTPPTTTYNATSTSSSTTTTAGALPSSTTLNNDVQSTVKLPLTSTAPQNTTAAPITATRPTTSVQMNTTSVVASTTQSSIAPTTQSTPRTSSSSTSTVITTMTTTTKLSTSTTTTADTTTTSQLASNSSLYFALLFILLSNLLI